MDHRALRGRFERRAGTLRRAGRLRSPRAVAHLWPFARAFVAALALARVEHARGRLRLVATG